MAETSTLETIKQFLRSVVRLLAQKHLREPTKNDMQRILRMNEARGFPGMSGSIDCQHYESKNCPTSLAGQYKGKQTNPTVVMEAVADGKL